jgi:cardiolipin synthase A/B
VSWILAYSAIGWLIRAAMVPVVLRRQFAPGAAIAWLGIVFLHPYIGGAIYLLVGEARLKSGRIDLHRQLVAQLRHRPVGAARPDLDPVYQPMVVQAEKIAGMPSVPDNSIEFFADINPLVGRLIADIDAAKEHIHLSYYIFAPDGAGRQVADAVIRAAGRGIKCRVLADWVGSYTFFRRPVHRELIDAGVEVAAAMRVTRIRSLFPRVDLRNHRKLGTIDDRIAYVGSHNLIDADYYENPAGPWIDLSGRITGPIVAEVESVFREDWAFETGSNLGRIEQTPAPPGGRIAMQAVPTGPAPPGDTYRRLLLGAVQCAQKQVILTTPYFVPDEPTLVALTMAADRGVDVKLILPLTSNAFFTAAAGRSHFGRLLDAGVHIHLYRPGLLHSKTVTVDDAFALFGSANLDVRSFNLNFELSVMVYGRDVTEQLRKVQMAYLEKSPALTAQEWSRRKPLPRYTDGAIALLSPLL